MPASRSSRSTTPHSTPPCYSVPTRSHPSQGRKRPKAGEEDLPQDILRAIRRSCRDNGISKHLLPYLAKCRIIAQTIHPYMSLHRAFYTGVPDAARFDEDEENEAEQLEEEGNDEHGDNGDEENPGKKEPDNIEEEKAVFNAIMRLEPGFRSVVKACSADAGAFLGLIKHVINFANRGRGDDTSKLKGAIVELLYEDPKVGSRFEADYEVERLLGSDRKGVRGFYHIDTADLLCPLSMKAEFDEDPVAFTNAVVDGKIEITEYDWPSFLYESGTIYDERDKLTGLFRGPVLVKAFRHIFTGPSSALHANCHPNKTKAKAFELTKITPRMIAYTAAQVYLALSSAPQWNNYIDNFNLDDFYDHIVEFLEDGAGSTFMKELLEWWDEQVPGIRPVKGKKKGQSRPGRPRKGPTPAEELKAQLQERNRELEEAKRQLREKERRLEEQERRLNRQSNYRPGERSSPQHSPTLHQTQPPHTSSPQQHRLGQTLYQSEQEDIVPKSVLKKYRHHRSDEEEGEVIFGTNETVVARNLGNGDNDPYGLSHDLNSDDEMDEPELHTQSAMQQESMAAVRSAKKMKPWPESAQQNHPKENHQKGALSKIPADPKSDAHLTSKKDYRKKLAPASKTTARQTLRSSSRRLLMERNVSEPAESEEMDSPAPMRVATSKHRKVI